MSLPTISHTKDEWDRIRPILVRLYVDEGRKLDQVRAILRHRHGFHATPKQCKTRLKQWNVVKNNKERELLHAFRIMHQYRAAGKGVSIRLRGENISTDDVRQHFRRKRLRDVDLILRIPSSPTPSVLSCSSSSTCGDDPMFSDQHESHEDDLWTPEETREQSLEIVEDLSRRADEGVQSVQTSDALVTHTGIVDDIHNHFSPSLQISVQPSMHRIEIGLFSLRDFVNTSILRSDNDLRASCPEFSGVIDRLENTKYQLETGNLPKAISCYAGAQLEVDKCIAQPNLTLLQFISHLFSRSTYRSDASSALVSSLLSYLTCRKDIHLSPVLCAIAHALADRSQTKEVVLLLSRYLCAYMAEMMGDECLIVVWLKARLCRHLFLLDDEKAAYTLFEETYRTYQRIRCRLDPTQSVELCRTIGATIHMMQGHAAAKQHIEELFARSAIEDVANHYGLVYCLFRLALCNFKLGFYEEAFGQATECLAYFSKTFERDDFRTRSAVEMITEIQKAADRVISDASLGDNVGGVDFFRSCMGSPSTHILEESSSSLPRSSRGFELTEQSKTLMKGACLEEFTQWLKA